MRHGNRINHLSRTTSHRKAMLMNMANSLILKKRINTTLAKAKELKTFVEPIITKSKVDSTASRRHAFGLLQDKTIVGILFREVAVKVADRPGGYTRILKTGCRKGDNAEMCMIELVDFNEIMLAAKTTGAVKKTKTTRRSKKKATTEEATEEAKDSSETKTEESKSE